MRDVRSQHITWFLALWQESDGLAPEKVFPINSKSNGIAIRKILKKIVIITLTFYGNVKCKTSRGNVKKKKSFIVWDIKKL